MTTKRLYQLLPVVIILISLESISSYINLKSTTFWWILNGLIIYYFIEGRKYFSQELSKTSRNIVLGYLAWNLLSVIRGVFIAETYWDWKQLVDNSLALFIPTAAFHAVEPAFIGAIIKNYKKYCLPLFLLIFLMIQKSSYGFYLTPVGFLVLFFPVLANKWRIIVAGICVFVLFADQTNRSNFIKFGLPCMLMLLYYFRSIFTVRVLNVLFVGVIFLPLIFFLLAITGKFNVFKMDEYVADNFEQESRNKNGEVVKEDLRSDTRTQLYTDVLETANKYDSWLLGRSPARGNETTSFSDIAAITGREERSGNEVAVLNVFTWTGITGVFLCFIIFLRASFLAINRSNNYFIKIVGIFMAFRWAYSWAEDINNFTLNYFFIWFMIAMCLSHSFREMDNQEFTEWLSDCF